MHHDALPTSRRERTCRRRRTTWSGNRLHVLHGGQFSTCAAAARIPTVRDSVRAPAIRHRRSRQAERALTAAGRRRDAARSIRRRRRRPKRNRRRRCERARARGLLQKCSQQIPDDRCPPARRGCPALAGSPRLFRTTRPAASTAAGRPGLVLPMTQGAPGARRPEPRRPCLNCPGRLPAASRPTAHTGASA